MSRAIAVLRPEPGNAATAARVEAMGYRAIRLPLFHVQPLDWSAPDAAGFDALILTSANAARLAGPELAALAALPVHAVGAATAQAARAAGLRVAAVGEGNAVDLIAAAQAAGVRRSLFLCGRDRALDAGGIVARAIPVYAADPLPVEGGALADTVALLHSARAARRLGEIADQASLRPRIRVAAISAAVADAAGPGWATLAAAARPEDSALLALAASLAD